MFGPPGRLYAYRSYGIHTCVNLVCGPEGEAAAVLLRALEPTCGRVRMRQLRGLASSASDRLIARGPGRLAQALSLQLEDDGMSALGGALRLRAAPAGSARVESGPRIGISKATDLRYRFYEAGSPWVSPFRGTKPKP
jgi:DNA-3-methyladenine glycosylase